MQSLDSSSSFLLSPTMRKQRHDLMNALSTLQAAVHELQSRPESAQPNLRSREILQHSNKAIVTIKSYIDHQFESLAIKR